MKVSIRCSNGDQHTVEFDENITVSEFKEVIERQTSIPADQQRLIYRGKVLKDAMTLKEYNVQDGYAVHLVRGAPSAGAAAASGGGGAPAPTPAATSTTTSSTTSPFTSPPPSAGTAGAGTGGMPNPFSMFGGGGGGMPGLNDPESLAQAMNNPLVQSMLSDPDLMREMMMANPQMRQIMENNPEVGALLRDPEMLRRSIELARNPSLMREMTRNTDRAMSNIENLPGGFDALRRMYTDVQRPMEEAAQSMMGGGSGDQEPTGDSQHQADTAGGPMPNPWGRPSPNTGTDTNAAGAGAGAGAGFGFGGGGTGGMFGMGGMDYNQMQQMMQNPAMQRILQNLMQNPEFMQRVIESNPMLSQMTQNNPFMRSMLSNPELLRSMFQMQGLFGQPTQQEQQQQQAPNFGNMFASMFPNMGGGGGGEGGTGTATAAAAGQTTTAADTASETGQPQQQQQQQPNVNPFANPELLNQMMQSMFGGGGGGAQSPFQGSGTLFGGANLQPPRERYRDQIQQLQEMGFYDEQSNIRALEMTQGNVSAAVDWLLSNPPPSSFTPRQGGGGQQ